MDAPRDGRRAFDVIVRRATPGDLDGICAVAESVRLNPLHAQEGGFLVYVLDRQGYANRLAASELFYVAIDRGEVVGFLLCYDDRTVVDLVGQGVLSDDLLRARAVAGCDGRWIYGDQLAVHPAHACEEVGISLAWELYRQLRNRGSDSVFVAILHDPPNTRSKAFCEALGFVFKGTLRYKDGRLWGLYSRKIPVGRTGPSASGLKKAAAESSDGADRMNDAQGGQPAAWGERREARGRHR